jgi:hypothetical protein
LFSNNNPDFSYKARIDSNGPKKELSMKTKSQVFYISSRKRIKFNTLFFTHSRHAPKTKGEYKDRKQKEKNPKNDRCEARVTCYLFNSKHSFIFTNLIYDRPKVRVIF